MQNSTEQICLRSLDRSIFGGVGGFSMQFDVLLASMTCVLVRMNCVAMSYVRVVSRGFVIAIGCPFSGSAVVFSRLFVMLGRLLVMFLQFFHDRPSMKYCVARRGANYATTYVTAARWRIDDSAKCCARLVATSLSILLRPGC